MTSAILLGLTLGLRHALDPDHLAAMSTLVARDRRPGRASVIGAVWGLGHGAMVIVIGAIAVLLGLGVPERFSLVAEIGVALLLVALGVGNLVHARQHPAHGTHGVHPPTLRRALWRSAFIGVAHGLAGTGLVAVMAVAAFPDPTAALLYLGTFATATLAGMVACSLLLSAPFLWLHDTPRVHTTLHLVTGLASTLVGLFLLLECGLSLWSRT